MENINNKKGEYGQFFTTNYDYILSGFSIPDNIKNIIEPFAGQLDILNFIKDRNKYKIECYEIDDELIKKNKLLSKRDSILNPPNYKNKYVITNPPYLARNKCKNKEPFEKYGVNDLYKCLISELIKNKALGGILLTPLNFWSSIRKMDIELRKRFLSVYYVSKVNVFEEQVFNDTSYTICSFQFELISDNKKSTLFTMFPSKNQLLVSFQDANNYMIGGELYKLPEQNKYQIGRMIKGDKKSTNLLVKCIDDNEKNKICIKYVDDKDIYIDATPNKTARTYMTLTIKPPINNEQQKKLADKFNLYLNAYRKQCHSLFLTNYRESNKIARKRISFDLVYSIVGYLLSN